jgi:hypothetical protein
MAQHTITFDNLADWLDGRLEGEARARVEAHLAQDCPVCQADLAVLRRFVAAAQAEPLAEPSVKAVAQAKALYRPSRFRAVAAPAKPARSWWGLLMRPVMALTVVLVMVFAASWYSVQTPTLFARHATLQGSYGTVEARAVGAAEWRTINPGLRLPEGEQVRVSDGPALLTLFDGSRLELQPGAEIMLSTLRSGLLGRAHQVALNQAQGYIYYEVTPLARQASSFEVLSPNARVAVRGTGFAIVVGSDADTKVVVMHGAVQVSSPQETTLLSERQGVMVPLVGALVTLPTLVPTPTTMPTRQQPEAATPQVTLTRPRSTGEATTPLPSILATVVMPPTPGDAVRENTPTERNEDSPTAVPTSAPSATLLVVATATASGGTPTLTPRRPTLVATETPSPTDEPTVTPRPTRWPLPTLERTREPSPIFTRFPTREPQPTVTPRPPRPTNVPEPTATPRPTREPRPTDPPAPTATPRPPRPTDVPEPTRPVQPTVGPVPSLPPIITPNPTRLDHLRQTPEATSVVITTHP